METPLIQFDRSRHPGLEIEILALDDVPDREALDHDPRAFHRVEFFVLLIVSGGTGSHAVDFEDYPMSAGTILTIRKDRIHKFQGSGLQGYIVLFTEEFAVSHMDKQESHKLHRLYNELLFEQCSLLSGQAWDEIWGLAQSIHREFHETRDSLTPGILRNLLQLVISRVYRHRQTSETVSADSRTVEQFVAFQALVEAHCQTSKSVQYYADRMAVSPRTLNNVTQRILGKTAKTCIDEILVLHIKRLLINTPISIKEIAYSCGFSEPTNLYRYFRKHTGSTPEVFRAQHRVVPG